MSQAVAIAFVRVDAAQNPNLRRRGTGDPLEPYYKAMVVAFASVRRWNPDIALQLITNELPRAPYAEQLGSLDVTIRMQAFDHCPPPGFAERFAGSLYMLDAARSCQDQDTVFIDPDVVCMRSLERMLDEVGQGVGAMPLNYPADTSIGGLTLAEAGVLHDLLGEPLEGAVTHYGGECYVIPARWARIVNERAATAWRFSLERHGRGQVRFPTEEHILSYALRATPVTSLLPHVRRIWTSATYRTIHGDEADITLWHLPSEKDHGFRVLHRHATDRTSWFWTSSEDEYLRRLGRVVGVTARSPARLLRDTAARARKSVKMLLSGKGLQALSRR